MLKCNACGFSYETHGYLLLHLRNLSTDDLHAVADYGCDCTAETLFTVSQLIKHLEQTHTTSQIHQGKTKLNRTKVKYKCRDCLKEFNDRRNLRQHENIHSRKSTFECKYCKHKFFRKFNLAQHLSIHERNEVDTLQCAVCGREYMSRSAMKLHFRVHTNCNPFSCPWNECHGSFRTTKLLQSHYKREHLESTRSNQRSYSPASATRIIQHIAELTGPSINSDSPLTASETSAFKKVAVHPTGVADPLGRPKCKLTRRASESVQPNRVMMVRVNTSMEV